MTNKEITEALRCCTGYKCNNCPYDRKGRNILDMQCVASMANDSLDLINRQNAKIARLKKEFIEQQLKNNLLYETAKEARTEAIKEFADRLKEIDDYVSPLDIDNLVKEMTEEKP